VGETQQECSPRFSLMEDAQGIRHSRVITGPTQLCLFRCLPLAIRLVKTHLRMTSEEGFQLLLL
jgi:hypothetical protein